MLAVTIATGRCYRQMAEAAKASFEQYTDMEVRILTLPKTRVDDRLDKLWLFDMLPGEDRFFYFDADVKVLEPVDLSFGWTDGFSAVLHPGRIHEIFAYDLDPEKYFNSGIMWLDREQHLEMFERAKAMPERWLTLGDQTQLNIAAKELGIKLVAQDEKYNCIIGENDDIPEGTVIAHYPGGPSPWTGRQRMRE